MNRTLLVATTLALSALIVLPDALAMRADLYPQTQRISRRARVSSVRSARSVSSRSSVRRSSSSVSSRSSATSRSSAGSVDTLPDRVTAVPHIVELGVLSPVLAQVSVFSYGEPMQLDEAEVALAGPVESIDRLQVYRSSDGMLLGSATRDNSSTYTLRLGKNISIGQRETYRMYVRALLRPYRSGGVSGESLQVSSITVRGTGEWSNDTLTKGTTETFSTHETARGRIAAISNAGASLETVIPMGTGQEVAKLRFTGTMQDNLGHLELQTLRFTISTTGGVTVSNVNISAEDTTNRSSCSLLGNVATCNVPADMGALDNDSRILRVFADVADTTSSSRALLQVSLQDAGSISFPGSVTWTDGSTSFDWVDLESPLVRGTLFQR